MLEIFDALLDRLLALEAAMLWGGVISWIFFACLVGAIGSGRGQSGIVFFLLSIMLSPLLALLVLYFSPDLRRRQLLALESRIAMLEAQEGLSPSEGVSAPVMRHAAAPVAEGGSVGRGVATVVLIILLIVVAILGGVSQLGKSANTTFTTITDAM